MPHLLTFSPPHQPVCAVPPFPCICADPGGGGPLTPDPAVLGHHARRSRRVCTGRTQGASGRGVGRGSGMLSHGARFTACQSAGPSCLHWARLSKHVEVLAPPKVRTRPAGHRHWSQPARCRRPHFNPLPFQLTNMFRSPFNRTPSWCGSTPTPRFLPTCRSPSLPRGEQQLRWRDLACQVGPLTSRPPA